MRPGALRLRGMSVRKKLMLVSVTPILVTSGFLLALFFWGHALTARAYEDAIAWERHSRALQNLDWTARFYLDSVSDRAMQDALPHAAAAAALARARAESLWLSRRFSAAEQADEVRLDTHLHELVTDGERVGNDRSRLRALEAKFHDSIEGEIHARIEEEEAGSARAILAANALSRNVHVGGTAIAILALLAAVCASLVAVRRFSERVAALEATAARVAAGHLEGDLAITSGDELGRLTGSLNAMVQALRHQRARQLEFLASVAHDLKNPLGAMHMSAQLLVQKADLPPEPILRKAIALIQRQLERLRRMVDDLLDATAIEAGALKLAAQSCDLRAVAHNVVELYKESSSLHELRIAAPAEPVMVVCDPTRVAQVLDNLVNNAIKYSPAGGTVDVTVTADAEEVILAVVDTGPGIEAGMREVIFEPFRRASSAKDVLPGVGLGLSTCRRIVVAHGGRIDVTSEPGRGATFRVHLPRRAAAPPPSAGSELLPLKR